MLPLILLAFSALMSQAIANENTLYTFDNGTTTWSSPDAWNTTLNGTDTSYEIEDWSINASFDLQTGVLALVIIMIAIGVVVGFNVVGSGPNSQATKIIYTSLFFFTLWGLLSVFGLPAIIAVPIFGWVFYFFLTLFYSVGIIQQINGA